MKIRIKFSADVFVDGDTLEEIRGKWADLDLFSDKAYENGVLFNDYLSIEDAETGKDMMREFWQYNNK